MLLSNDPVASSSREPTVGAAGETSDVKGETQGNYPSVLGDTVITGKTSSVIYLKELPARHRTSATRRLPGLHSP